MARFSRKVEVGIDAKCLAIPRPEKPSSFLSGDDRGARAEAARAKVEGTRSDGSSCFKGASWSKSEHTWMTEKQIGGNKKISGYFIPDKMSFPADSAAPIVKGGRGGFMNPSSQYKGVCWDKGRGKWMARTRKDGKQSHLGYFDDEEEAARCVARAENAKAPDVLVADAWTISPRRSSQFKGVIWSKGLKKWQARVRICGKMTHLGYFDFEEEAAHVCDKVAAHQGKPVNFPPALDNHARAMQGSGDNKRSHENIMSCLNGEDIDKGQAREEAAPQPPWPLSSIQTPPAATKKRPRCNFGNLGTLPFSNQEIHVHPLHEGWV